MGMRLIADRYDMCASTSYMDLSVEAEAFGAHTVYGVDEIPTIIGKLIETEEDADALRAAIESIDRAMSDGDTLSRLCGGIS